MPSSVTSWAVPRGPSTDPRVKRLAVRVPDHAMEHADFEGATGASGSGGAVLIWDRGHYRNLRADQGGSEVAMDQALTEGKVEVWLAGHKLLGGYTLVRMRRRDPAENWLLIKERDAAADAIGDPLRDAPLSVVTGRSLEEIADNADGRLPPASTAPA